MVRFVIGRSGSGKSSYVRDEVKRLISETDAEITVIVPEQQTVSWEAKMAQILPDTANLRIEITNFTRLSNSVFREYGGLSKTLIDEGTRALLVWRAMLEEADSLSVYGDTGSGKKKVRLDKNIERLMKATDELKNSGVSPAEAERALRELEAKSEGDGDRVRGGLADRLADATLVYAAYNRILGDGRIDRADLHGKLGEALSTCPYFRGKYVFVDSFFSLTAAEEKILSQIIRQAKETTVTFTCPTEAAHPQHDAVEEMQFAEVKKYLRGAKSAAARWGAEVEYVLLSENLRHKNSAALRNVEKYLFNYSATLPETDDDDSVTILKCADRYDEAEACAAIIDRLVREGYYYSDIAVVAADMTSREGILDSVLRRHGIRCFMSEMTEVSTSPVVRLITSALRVEETGWSKDEIIKMIKTGMTPLSEAHGEGELSPEDVFETYISTWNINGRRMYSADAWSMNPEGYKIGISDTGRKILLAVNEGKEKLIPPLMRFLSVFEKGAADVRDIAERVVYFAEDYGVEESIFRMAEAYRMIGMESTAKKTESMWGAVCDILDKMTSALQGVSLDAGTFCNLFLKVASSMDVGSIPTGIDEVVLGSAAGVRFDSAKCVILLGSKEGEFPSPVSSERDFFDDRDKMELEGVGLIISSPDITDKSAREQFMYYRTASAPSEKLYVLVPMDGDGQLSEGAVRIGKITEKSPLTFGELPLSEVVFTEAAAEYQLSRRNSPEERELLWKLCKKAEGRELSTGKESFPPLANANEYLRMNLSESRIESFSSCPFSYTCKYLAKLRPEARAEIKTPDIGTFVHSVLESFFASLSAEDMEQMPLPPEKTEEIADGIIGEYVRALGKASGEDGEELSGRLRYLFVTLRRHVLVFLEAIMRELSQSEFRPVAYELGISEREGDASPIVFRFADGEGVTEVVLRGIADRVDVYTDGDGRKFVRIIDYKTGSKEFSLDDVSKGVGVQLLVYLFSLWKSGIPGVAEAGELNPGGALYFSVKPQVHSSQKMLTPEEAREISIDSISRSGILLADENVLTAMDKALAGKYVSVSVDKGQPESTAKSTTLVSAEGFGKIYTDLEEIICGIASRMRRGEASAQPSEAMKNSPCKWCDMKYICRRGE